MLPLLPSSAAHLSNSCQRGTGGAGEAPCRGCLRRGLINSTRCRSRFLRAPLFKPGNIYRASNKRRQRVYCIWYFFSRLIYHCHVCSFLPSAFLSPGNAVISFIIGHYIMHSIAASVVFPRPDFFIQTQFCNQSPARAGSEAEPCRDTCTLSLKEEEKPLALRHPNLRIGPAKLSYGVCRCSQKGRGKGSISAVSGF